MQATPCVEEGKHFCDEIQEYANCEMVHVNCKAKDVVEQCNKHVKQLVPRYGVFAVHEV